MLKGRWICDDRLECGCDEAGRGCLAGFVVAAAVILPDGWVEPRLNDSKQLPERERERLAELIKREALAWGIGECTPEEIDEINILRASHLAMHRAISALGVVPDRLLIDGNRFTPYEGIEHHCIVKGDAKVMSIAAASILAKTHRDEEMRHLDALYPAYGFAQHKGYPTKAHREAIARHGASPLHRKTFRLLNE